MVCVLTRNISIMLIYSLGGDEVDIPDESAAYMEFLNNEAQSRGQPGFGAYEDDEILEEETLLETPLDLIEPYQLFRGALLSKIYYIVFTMA